MSLIDYGDEADQYQALYLITKRRADRSESEVERLRTALESIAGPASALEMRTIASNALGKG